MGHRQLGGWEGEMYVSRGNAVPGGLIARESNGRESKGQGKIRDSAGGTGSASARTKAGSDSGSGTRWAATG